MMWLGQSPWLRCCCRGPSLTARGLSTLDVPPSPRVEASARTDAAKSFAEGRGLSLSKPNTHTKFVVYARDVQGTDRPPPLTYLVAAELLAGVIAHRCLCFATIGRPRKTGGDSLTVVINGPARVHAVVSDNHDGSYTVTYMPSLSGKYQIFVAIKNFTIQGSPFSMNCGPRTSSCSEQFNCDGWRPWGRVFDWRACMWLGTRVTYRVR